MIGVCGYTSSIIVPTPPTAIVKATRHLIIDIEGYCLPMMSSALCSLKGNS